MDQVTNVYPAHPNHFGRYAKTLLLSMAESRVMISACANNSKFFN